MHESKLAEEIARYDFRVKVALLVVSLGTVGLLAIAAYRDNFAAPWRRYQLEYRELLARKAQTPADRDAAAEFPIELRQLVVPDLGAVDRCVSCHVGFDDPRMTDVELPFRAHPGKLLEIHDPARFGCTSCHAGQGLATEVDSAHGLVAHWDHPMVERRYLGSTCGRCHGELDLFGADQESYAGVDGSDEIPRESLRRRGPEAAGLAARGKQLVLQKGCLGCHTYRGKGGSLGPDLTHVGDKTRHDFDFSRFGPDEERTVERWLTKHFIEPQEISPGTIMPPLSLGPEDTEALTGYMLALRAKSVPGTHRPRPRRGDATPASGAELFGLFCSACHGVDGRESEVPGLRTPALNNQDFLAVASDDYLRAIISSGRTGSNMPAWGAGAGNLSRDEIDRLVAHIRGWEARGADPRLVSSQRGSLESGRRLYLGNCANCHGSRGEGGVGNALRSWTFLAVASDEMLARTIVHGRPGTAMPSWRELSADEVSDLLAYMRSWQTRSIDRSEVIALSDSLPDAVALGERAFASHCAACHGARGAGGIGVSLSSPDFLRRVDRGYLFDAIIEGRPGTAMPAWRHLTAEQLAGLLAYIESWQAGEDYAVGASPPSGDWQHGELVFRTACSACHGTQGQGGMGPQITNPAFLRSATDAQLFAWIGHGKAGTAMKGFLRRSEGVVSLSESQVVDVIAFLRHRGTSGESLPAQTGVGDSRLGAELWAGNCASCHGPFGEGGSGPQLNNVAFLESASDGYLAATIVLGRIGTPMRSMVHGLEGLAQISPVHVEDLVAFLRQWAWPPTWRTPRPAVELTDQAITAGAHSYAQLCASCHGPTGRGAADGSEHFAPSLNNPEFLRSASDGFLLATIARGRAGTPMRPFGFGSGGLAELSSTEIHDIVSFLRSWDLARDAHLAGSGVTGELTSSPVAVASSGGAADSENAADGGSDR